MFFQCIIYLNFQLISLSDDTNDPDDDVDKNATAKKPQRRLRALLILIENILRMIIECDDRSHQMKSPTSSKEVKLVQKYIIA